MFAEPLPEQCPPENAAKLSESTEFFRVASSNPVSIEDFRSVKWLNPNRQVDDNCIASGLSIFQRESDTERILKLPSFKNGRVVKIVLGPTSGLILATPRNAACSHFTWWPFKEFDILSSCEERN